MSKQPSPEQRRLLLDPIGSERLLIKIFHLAIDEALAGNVEAITWLGETCPDWRKLLQGRTRALGPGRPRK